MTQTSTLPSNPRPQQPTASISMPPKASFKWGLFGALLPELLRFYKLVTLGENPPFSWIWLIVFLFFVVAAGLLAVAWQPENAFKAIWVGVSFPVIVSTMMQTVPPLPGKGQDHPQTPYSHVEVQKTNAAAQPR